MADTNKNPLKDQSFLLKMDNLQLRHQYARITVLDFFTEKILEDITGKITSGSISMNGDSCVRRTANLTFIIEDPDKQNLFKVSNSLSINKKIKLEVGLENTTEYYTDYPIIWYPQGIYIITQPAISYSSSGLTVSLQLKDKMCLLNGDCGGLFPAQTTLSELEDTDPSGNVIVRYPTIYQIIQEMVNHFGGEQLGKIIINDLSERTYQIMICHSSNTIYATKTSSGNDYVFRTSKKEEDKAEEFHYGEPICYAPTDFVYPGELVVNAGSSITSALDTIKNTLGGNFEYFYDLNGNFVFQEIKNYVNMTQAQILQHVIEAPYEDDGEIYKTIRQMGKTVYDFSNSPLIISYNVTPNYLNIKNDFLVWGVRKSGYDNKKYPIRYHLAIDRKPALQKFEHVFVYKSNIDSDVDLIRAQVPFLINVDDIYDYGIGSPGVVYWIHKGYGNDTFYVWSEDKVDYINVNSVGHLCNNYEAKDWRTVLYLQGSMSDPYGIESNYYYTELKNEWPKLYDLRPKKEEGYKKTDKMYFDRPGKGQTLWPEFIEDPTKMEYYLDFIDTGSIIDEFNVENIGRRQKVLQDDSINCIFQPRKFCDTVAIRQEKEADIIRYKKMEDEKNQCKIDGRAFSEVEPGIYDTFAIGTGFYSAYEEIRTNLQEYTDYNESLQISCIPIFHLEPNTIIQVENRELNIKGNYLIKSISVPLGSGTMSINTNKVVEKL